MYAKALSYFMKYLGLNINDYDKLLDKDVKLIQMNICDFITHLKVDHSAACVSAYVAAISKFYTMNDVTTLNWKKIKSFMGEHEKIAEDRPYTHSERRYRAVLMAAALIGIFTTSLSAYADESETSTDQEIEQKNVGSGDSNNNNCAKNEIDSWATAAGDTDCHFNNTPPTVCPATLFSCML
jgi:hypothetical protein